jgi:putative membrane protein
MKGTSVALLSLALMALPVFAKQGAKEAGKAPMTDQQFADFAAQTDMTEANLGQVAQDKGGQAVKDYGQMLRTDHTNDYNQLNDAAQKAGLTVPKGIDAEHDRMISSLDKLKGAAFDRRFAREMIQGHEHAIAVYQKEQQDAQSPDIKAYAQQALPTLESHLEKARQLEKPGQHAPER